LHEGPAELTEGRFRQTERFIRMYAPNLADLCKPY